MIYLLEKTTIFTWDSKMCAPTIGFVVAYVKEIM